MKKILAMIFGDFGKKKKLALRFNLEKRTFQAVHQSGLAEIPKENRRSHRASGEKTTEWWEM